MTGGRDVEAAVVLGVRAAPASVCACRWPACERVVPCIVHLIVNDSFRAIASPVRRRIVERLASGPATVGEATSGLGVTKPAITKHLRVLEEAGLVTRVIDGRTHRLTLNAEALAETSEWIGPLRSRWERVFDAVNEFLEDSKESG